MEPPSIENFVRVIRDNENARSNLNLTRICQNNHWLIGREAELAAEFERQDAVAAQSRIVTVPNTNLEAHDG